MPTLLIPPNVQQKPSSATKSGSYGVAYVWKGDPVREPQSRDFSVMLRKQTQVVVVEAVAAVAGVLAERAFRKGERGRVIVEPSLEYAAMEFTLDPFADWIRAHRAEMQKYIGRFVVIDGRAGILGAGDDPVELGERLDPERRCMVTFVAPDLYGSAAP